MIRTRLEEIAAISTQECKIEEYKKLLKELFEHEQLDPLKNFAVHIVSSSTPPVACHAILKEFSEKLPTLGNELHIELAKCIIEKIQPRASMFEEEISKIREGLAATYESRKQWLEAAKTLVEIPLESNRHALDAYYLIDTYIKIARNFLESEHTEAERYLTKAANLISDRTELSLVISYTVCLSRCYELKQKYSEAAVHYHKLSRIFPDESDREAALENAIICTIMTGAGPLRSRQLGILYKDERSAELKLYPILQKVFTDRILRKREVEEFVALLKTKPNFSTNTACIMPALDKAIREHNLLSASKVYLNISFDELAVLLDVDAGQAERLATTMISEGRLQGDIDQLERTINFEQFDAIKLWDVHIELTCLSTNKILDMIAAKHAQFIGLASKLQPE